AVNVFLRDGDAVYRTWHTNGRGTEQLSNTFALIDLLPYGRQEEWQDSPEGWPQSPTYSRWASSEGIAALYGPDACGRYLARRDWRRAGSAEAYWLDARTCGLDSVGRERGIGELGAVGMAGRSPTLCTMPPQPRPGLPGSSEEPVTGLAGNWLNAGPRASPSRVTVCPGPVETSHAA